MKWDQKILRCRYQSISTTNSDTSIGIKFSLKRAPASIGKSQHRDWLLMLLFYDIYVCNSVQITFECPLHYKRYYLECVLVHESTLYSWPHHSRGCLCVSVWYDHMTRRPHDQGKARTASPNPGPIHAGEPDHKNCRVWRWFWWRQSPTKPPRCPTHL